MKICEKCKINDVRLPKSIYCQSCYDDVRSETTKKSYLKHKDKRNAESVDFKSKNKEYIKSYNKFYSTENKEDLSEKRKKKRIDNKEKLNADSIRWRSLNKEKVREYNRKHGPLYRKKYPWIYACRTLINNTTKRFGTKKEDKTIVLLGYSAEELKSHIESKFTDNMNWENYGEWHIDHIIPVSKFSKDTPMDVVNALDNLQPLWGIDNLKKGNR